MNVTHAQITPIDDAQANAAAMTQLASWRNSVTTVSAQAARVDSVAFVDGGVIVFPIPNAQPVQLTLALQPDNYFTVSSTDSRFGSAVLSITGRVYIGISMVLVGGDSYLLVPVEDGAAQHLLVQQNLRKISIDPPGSPDGNPSGEPLRGGPGGTINSNKAIKSVQTSASDSGPAD